jgi:DNA-binding GntR family transcriptional regulator
MVPRPGQEEGAGAPPLYEVIYAVLREHIVEGSFPAGLVLGEASVARAFNASRVPAAAALKRLHREGLVRDHHGRGYLAGAGPAGDPVRLTLDEAGLRLPVALAEELRRRNRRERIYPDVEHTVAACLSYGRFLINESALAEYYGVSRTVAHEVLTRLERAGLATQQRNQRWYAGPLTNDLLREHYEMRWLLEPIALGQAGPRLTTDELKPRLAHIEKAQRGRREPASLERLEHDLHVAIVLKCDNAQLRETIRRSQLPILATHSTFQHLQEANEISTMLAEHRSIIGALMEGRIEAAKSALEQHLRRSMEPNLALLEGLRFLTPPALPPYLVPASR